MRRKFLQNIGPVLPGLEISEELPRLSESILSLEDSLARTSAVPENEQALQGNAVGYGPSSTVSFANYDLAMFLWRTSQLSFTGDLIEFSGIWPRAGMMRNGQLYQRHPLARRTLENAFSLWRTPQVADSKSARIQSGFTTNLTHQVMYPTPLGTDATGGSSNRSPGSKNVRPSLARMAIGNKWPTPIASDWRSGKSSEETQDKNSRPLREIAAQGQASGQLNPEWVEWLMGFPIGWTDLER